MKTVTVQISGAEITDTERFHDVFARAFGFPAFYGRNLDALADCLLSVDQPEHGMVDPAIAEHDFLLLRIDDAHLFKRNCPHEFEVLIEIVAFENQRRVEAGLPPVMGLVLVGDLGA